MLEQPCNATTARLIKAALALSAPCYIALMILFGSSLVYLLYRRLGHGEVGAEPSLGLWIIGYFVLISVIFFGEPRFHFPLIPWLTMYIGGAVGELVRSLRSAEQRLIRRPAPGS